MAGNVYIYVCICIYARFSFRIGNGLGYIHDPNIMINMRIFVKDFDGMVIKTLRVQYFLLLFKNKKRCSTNIIRYRYFEMIMIYSIEL